MLYRTIAAMFREARLSPSSCLLDEADAAELPVKLSMTCQKLLHNFTHFDAHFGYLVVVI